MKNDPAPRSEGQSYIELTGPAEYEEKIQRSVFIGRAEPCHSEVEARELLNCVRAAHRDATHNCWAYRISLLGPESVTEYSSDDGEPSGTAGRPILGAIQRYNGLFNVLVVVTRYFGGVKLGVRGLIEAYGGVSIKTLNAAKTVERVPVRLLAVRLPWGSVGTVTRLLEGNGAEVLSWDYDTQETLAAAAAHGCARLPLAGEDGKMSSPGVSVTARVPCAVFEPLTQTLETLKAQRAIENWEDIKGGA
ncbi:MAG: YigZ family protein [Fretibacterium sp.]|nr:YigZ family protein [Fretibacterium sp.]